MRQVKLKFHIDQILIKENTLISYDIASGSEITLCNKIDKALVVYRFLGNVIK